MMTPPRDSFEIGDLIYVTKTPAGVPSWVREAYCTQEPFLLIDFIYRTPRSGRLDTLKVLDRTGVQRYLRPKFCEVMCLRAEQ